MGRSKAIAPGFITEVTVTGKIANRLSLCLKLANFVMPAAGNENEEAVLIPIGIGCGLGVMTHISVWRLPLIPLISVADIGAIMLVTTGHTCD